MNLFTLIILSYSKLNLKSIGVAIFLIVSFTQLHANETDSLRQLYLKKANSYLYNDGDSAYNYISLCLELAKNEGLDSVLAESYQLMGIWHYLKANLNESHAYFDSAYVIFERQSNALGRAEVLKNRAFLVQKGGDIASSVELFLECKTIYEELNKKYEIAQVNANIGNSYFRLKTFAVAKDKYLKSLPLFMSAKEATISDVGGTYIALGNVYKALNDLDSSDYYYRIAAKTFRGNNQLAMSYIFNNMGGLFEQKGNLDSATFYYTQSIEIKNQLGNKRGYIVSSKNLSEILRKQKKYNEALKYIVDGYEIALSIQDSFLIRDYHQSFAMVYSEKGAYEKAVENYQKYIDLNEKLSGLEKTMAISEIEEQYENEKNEKRITELELENQKAVNERNLIFFCICLLLLVTIFLILHNIQRKKTSKTLKDKNSQISLALHDREILLKEIHHRVKNNLQVISSLLNLQAGSLSDEVAIDAVKDGQHRVKSMALIHQKLYQDDDLRGVEVHDYVKNLTSELMNTFGINADDLKVEIDIQQLKLDIDTLIPLGLIINELITNSLKYAFSKSEQGLLKIEMMEQNEKLAVIISDNGVGMNEEALTTANSFGWKMIRSLARKLKAEINITNRAGTEIELIISRYKLSV